MYHDRIDAGYKLTEELKKYKNDPCIILAVPRGGVPVAYVVARELGFPVDLVLTKKIGHPAQKEYAIGAVSLTDKFIIPHSDVSDEYIETETQRIRQRLEQMYSKFMGEKKTENLKGKILIVIDDGIATGNTMLATVKLLKKNNPSKIVIAVPVASESAIEKLSKHVDELICPYIPGIFFGISAFYEDFSQLTDDEIVEYLEKLKENETLHGKE